MIPPSELLGSAIRHAVCAPEGKVFAVADLGSIESRVLGWFTGCSRINKVFAEGKDTYKDFAVDYFRVPYDQVTKEQRNFSKPPVLGAGFGLGWKGMQVYAEGYGIELDKEEAKRVVETFRSSYWEVPRFWKWIETAVKYTTMSGAPVEGYRLTVHKDREFLCIRLPSGRNLWYFQPQILPHKTPWGEIKPTFSYMGLNDKNQWVRLFVHPGLLTENVTQAIARDFLAYGMNLASYMDIVLHVHDEIAVEICEKMAEDNLKYLIECMTTNPPWAPDIILGADGYIAKRYRKD
jgi:DNA polymerase